MKSIEDAIQNPAMIGEEGLAISMELPLLSRVRKKKIANTPVGKQASFIYWFAPLEIRQSRAGDGSLGKGACCLAIT